MFGTEIEDLKLKIVDGKKQNLKLKQDNELLKIKLRKFESTITHRNKVIDSLLNGKQPLIGRNISEFGASLLITLKEENERLKQEKADQQRVITRLLRDLESSKVYLPTSQTRKWSSVKSARSSISIRSDTNLHKSESKTVLGCGKRESSKHKRSVSADRTSLVKRSIEVENLFTAKKRGHDKSNICSKRDRESEDTEIETEAEDEKTEKSEDECNIVPKIYVGVNKPSKEEEKICGKKFSEKKEKIFGKNTNEEKNICGDKPSEEEGKICGKRPIEEEGKICGKKHSEQEEKLSEKKINSVLIQVENLDLTCEKEKDKPHEEIQQLQSCFKDMIHEVQELKQSIFSIQKEQVKTCTVLKQKDTNLEKLTTEIKNLSRSQNSMNPLSDVHHVKNIQMESKYKISNRSLLGGVYGLSPKKNQTTRRQYKVIMSPKCNSNVIHIAETKQRIECNKETEVEKCLEDILSKL